MNIGSAPASEKIPNKQISIDPVEAKVRDNIHTNPVDSQSH